MKIVTGSTNPVKRQAVESVLLARYPAAEFIALTVLSGVSDQPMGDVETRQGAVNRANAALNATGADMAVGLEGGVQETESGMFTCAWCAIVDNTGKTGIGGSSCVMLPNSVAEMIRNGVELGLAMDTLSKQQNTKHGLGAIGLLTDGLQTRQSAYEHLIQLALAPFIRQAWY